jgi:hypothetical protein
MTTLAFLIFIFIIIGFASGNVGSISNDENDRQRQERLKKQQEARQKLDELEKQQQEKLLYDRQKTEEKIKLEEQQRLLTEQKQQKILAEKQQILLSQIATYKTNWQDFQTVLKRNGVTKLYHFTDRTNLASIKKHGGLYSWYYCHKNGIKIPKPGGSPTSWILDERKGLQNYVRTSFVRDHPMLYVAKKDGRISSPVILEISVELIFSKGTKYATQNAVKNGVVADDSFAVFNSINFPVLKMRYFDLSEEDKPYYQAEVLVLEKIPLEAILNINNV